VEKGDIVGKGKEGRTQNNDGKEEERQEST